MHRQALQLYQEFKSGRYRAGRSPPLELQRSHELGLWTRRFQPLVAPATAAAPGQ